MPRQADSPNLQISWVYTADLDSTHEFYTRGLGLECMRDQGTARIYRTVPGAAIGVCTVHGDRVIEPRGSMISLLSDDVDACYRRLLDHGLAIAAAPHRDDSFGIYTFRVEDPNGYLIEFQQFLQG